MGRVNLFYMAGSPIPIETARAFNITLVNFLRGRGMNIASCPERIVDL